MKKRKSNLFKTDSFYFASYLIATGCELYGLEPYASDSNKVIFCFFNTEKLQVLREEYFSLRATIRPQDFANAQKTLKSIIYARK